MSKIGYMKVFDIIAKLFDAEREQHVDAIHDKADIFKARMKNLNGKIYECRLVNHKYHMDISFSKEYLEKNQFKKWLSNFEWELEQEFLTNIDLETDTDTALYKIKLTY